MAINFYTRKSCDPFEQSSSLVAVIELSKDSWLAGGIPTVTMALNAGMETGRLRGTSPMMRMTASWWAS